jgi:hypothetical protein
VSSEGDLCVVPDEDPGVYRIAKVLKIDEAGIHVRLFANRFDARPASVDPAELELGTVHDEHFGIGHLALHREEWARMQPEFLQHGTVDPEELDGYEMWREAYDEGEAGVWGDPDDAPAPVRWLRRLFGRR